MSDILKEFFIFVAGNVSGFLFGLWASAHFVSRQIQSVRPRLSMQALMEEQQRAFAAMQASQAIEPRQRPHGSGSESPTD